MSPKGVEHKRSARPHGALPGCIHQCRRKALSTCPARISSRQSPLERRIDEMLGTLEPGDRLLVSARGTTNPLFFSDLDTK